MHLNHEQREVHWQHDDVADEAERQIDENELAAPPFRVTVGFSAPEGISVLSGMTARVVVHPLRGQDESIRVPSNATAVDAEGNAYVWIVDPSSMRVRRTRVTLGEFSGADVAIQDGLSAGDQIAASGVSQLRDGMQISRLGE